MRLACTHVGAGWLRIGVTDSGIGIAADKMAELFKPFSRLDADKSEIQGTGVGLAVTKSLIELMGGASAWKARSIKAPRSGRVAGNSPNSCSKSSIA